MIAPALFLAWVRVGLDERVEGIHISPEPLIAPVQMVLDDVRVPATVEIEWAPGEELVSPGIGGLVTALYIAPGTLLNDGDRVIQVDGVDRLAVSAAAPFFRPLALRDTGADVEALQEFLRRTGRFEGEIDGVYGKSTADAVGDLETDLGFNKAKGVFEPSFVVWLPSDPFEVGTLLLGVADPAPPVGSAIAVSQDRVIAAEVTFTETAVHSTNPLELLVRDLRVPLMGEDHSLSGDGLEVLSSEIDPDVTSFESFVALTEPLSLWQVPTTSIAVGESGDLCVWLVTQKGSYEFSHVEVGSSSPTGTTFLVDGVEDGDRILVNPFEVLESPSCP